MTVLGFTVLQGVEWYEEGEGGYSANNGNLVPWNAASFLNTNSVTYAIMDGASVVGDEGDLLGAFYDGELRGIIGVSSPPFGPYAGSNLFLLYMYSNASGTEEFNFKFYDSSEGAVSDLPETYVFVADEPLGTITAPETLTYVAPSGGDGGGNGYVDTSGWNQEGEGGYTANNGNLVPWNAASFLNTNSITFAIQDDGVTIGDDGDLLGAFYDGELRGIIGTSTPPFGPYAGSNLFLLYMYSNESGTEEFNFKFYDESTGLTYDLDHTYVFVADEPLGTITAPVIITVELDDAVACDDVDADGICDDVDDCVGQLDECGVCNGTGIADGACDCDGNVEDCAGVCGGSSVEDDCGVCDGGNASQDCAGVCNGSSTTDNCGTCDDDPTNDCVADCNGDFGGDAVEDNCGTCDNDSSNDCVQDCAGEWGGTAWESDCGCVAADNSGDDCDDCAGTPNGTTVVDSCGTCGGPGPDAGHDCAGACIDDTVCGVAELSFGAVTPNSVEVLYTSNFDVGAFQFDLSGATLESVSVSYTHLTLPTKA